RSGSLRGSPPAADRATAKRRSHQTFRNRRWPHRCWSLPPPHHPSPSVTRPILQATEPSCADSPSGSPHPVRVPLCLSPPHSGLGGITLSPCKILRSRHKEKRIAHHRSRSLRPPSVSSECSFASRWRSSIRNIVGKHPGSS